MRPYPKDLRLAADKSTKQRGWFREESPGACGKHAGTASADGRRMAAGNSSLTAPLNTLSRMAVTTAAAELICQPSTYLPNDPV